MGSTRGMLSRCDISSDKFGIYGNDYIGGDPLLGQPIGDGIINGKKHEKHHPIFLLHMAIGKELVGQR